MDVEFKGTPTQLSAIIEMNLEAFVAGVGPEHTDTDESPEAALYRQYREMSPADLAAAFEGLSTQFGKNILVVHEGMKFNIEVGTPAIPAIGDVELIRFSRIPVTAKIPESINHVQVGWSAMMGQLIVRAANGGDGGYAAILAGGQLSTPLSIVGTTQNGVWVKFKDFARSAFGLSLLLLGALGILITGFVMRRKS